MSHEAEQNIQHFQENLHEISRGLKAHVQIRNSITKIGNNLASNKDGLYDQDT